MEENENLITTDIDRLLKYLVEKDSASVKEAAEELEVPEEMVDRWAGSLEDSGLLKKKYSTTRGTILQPDKEEIKKSVDSISKSAEDEIKKAHEEMEEGLPEIEEAKSHLQKLEKVISEEEKKSERLEEIMKKLKEDEEEIEEEYREGNVSKKALKILEEIDRKLGSMDEIDKEREKFQKRKKNIKSQLETLEKLEDYVKEWKQDSRQCNVCGEKFDDLKGLEIHKSKTHGESNEKESFIQKVKSFLT